LCVWLLSLRGRISLISLFSKPATILEGCCPSIQSVRVRRALVCVVFSQRSTFTVLPPREHLMACRRTHSPTTASCTTKQHSRVTPRRRETEQRNVYWGTHPRQSPSVALYPTFAMRMFVCYELVFHPFHIYSVLGHNHIKTTGLAVILFSVISPRTVPMPICEGGPEGSGD
jgi:hypothetical protein